MREPLGAGADELVVFLEVPAQVSGVLGFERGRSGNGFDIWPSDSTQRASKGASLTVTSESEVASESGVEQRRITKLILEGRSEELDPMIVKREYSYERPTLSSADGDGR